MAFALPFGAGFAVGLAAGALLRLGEPSLVRLPRTPLARTWWTPLGRTFIGSSLAPRGEAGEEKDVIFFNVQFLRSVVVLLSLYSNASSKMNFRHIVQDLFRVEEQVGCVDGGKG
jgi:hypothetical protein